MRLLLVRHGVADGHEGRAVGQLDLPLSERGRAAMRALLASGPGRPDRLVSSDLIRARDSAQILAAHWGMEVVTDTRLRELWFGEWEGRTWRQLERSDAARLERWMREWATERAPGGESFPDLVARVSSWLREWWRERAVGSTETTVVVAHAGSIRAILCRLLGVPLSRAFEFEVDWARVTALDLGEATPGLICRNSDMWPGESLAADERRCPVCGADNSCAVADGQSVSACWCHGSKLSREVLERIPRERRGTACVCQWCAEPPSPR
jgi:broad specificity phosphatase PhoE